MNSVISKKTRLNTVAGLAYWYFSFLFLVVFFSPQALQAEGSKDFIGNDGDRLFLDTRSDQQMKVYAKSGEFINIGSSHIGIQNGFIDVYRPDGTLHTRFDGSGANPNEAIIFNNVQEINGPIGGTLGYSPGVINVNAAEEGIWTVVFDYPTSSEQPYSNILNSAPWTRANNQPNSPVVVLAWDITISQNAAANNSGNMLTGRVYSNRYVSELFGNNNQTSATFYILSKDGFTYKVDFQDIDPYRFTVGSNSFGIVDGNLSPTYQSVAVGDYELSETPASWLDNQLYFYQLMAQDYQALINNKVFFNIPASDMPASAQVTNLFAPTTPDTHTTWLYSAPTFNPTINVSGFNYVGLNDEGIACDPNTAQTGIGGYVVFSTDLGGTTTLQLDMNGDNDFDDPVDRNIFDFVEVGTDSIFWDGNDGLGNPLPIGEGFVINYNISIRGGEIHIPLIDIENNAGGVNFSLIGENGMLQQSNMYYDHSNVGGQISGGGTVGNPLPSTDLVTWNADFGNNKIFDFWTYIPFEGDGSGAFTINISEDCVCQEATTPIVGLSTDVTDFCDGVGEVILSATNTTQNLDSLFYTYSNNSGFTVSDTVIGNQISSVTLGNAVTNLTDTYNVTIVSDRGCVSATDNINIVVNDNPVLGLPTLDAAEYCQGDAITMTTPINVTGDYNIELLAPNGDIVPTTSLQSSSPLVLILNDLSQSGDYSLNVRSTSQCVDTTSVNISINQYPQITEFNSSNGNSNCEGDSISINIQSNLSGNYTLEFPNANIIAGELVGSETTSIPLQNIGQAQAGTYTVSTISAGGCTSPTSSIDVAVASYPDIQMTGSGAYCEGNEITLNASNSISGTGDLTYIWTKDGVLLQETVAENVASSLLISDFSPSDAGTYQLAVSSQCGIEPITFELEFLSNLIYSNVQGDGTYCQYESVFLSAQSNQTSTDTVTYTWTGPNGVLFTGEAPISGPFPATIPSLENSGQYVLTIESQTFTCQSSPLALDLTVNASPVIGEVVGLGDYCENTPIELSALNSNPLVDTIDYIWTAPNGTNFTGTVAGNEPMAYTTTGAQNDWSGIWTLTVETENGCSTDASMVEVTVSPAHLIFDLSEENDYGTFCEGETLVFDAWNGNPAVDTVTWTWQNSNGVIAEGFSLGTDVFGGTIENLTYQDTGLYVLLLNSPGSACPEGVGIFTVNIDETPVIADVTGGGTVCLGDEVTLTGINTSEFTGELTYTWTGPNGFLETGTGNANSIFSVNIPNVTQDNIGDYSLSLVTANGCIAEDQEVTSIGLFTDIVPIIGANTDVACNGEEVILTSTAEGESYNWYFDNGNGGVLVATTTEGSLSINPFNFEDAGSYYVEIEATCGLSPASGTVSISTISGVDAFEDTAITDQDIPVDLTILNNDLLGNNNSVTIEIITAPENGTASLNANNTVTYTPNAGFSGTDTFVYQICSEVCLTTCDQALATITINPEIDEECFIPNYFTPNGDESNQSFYINCLETVYPDNNMTIYNRWGDEIFAAQPYKNDWIGEFNGNELPAGTYFYILNLTADGENCQQGYITIVK